MSDNKKEKVPETNIPFTSYFKGKKVSLIAFEKEDIPLSAKWNNTEEINAFTHSRFPASIFEQEEWYEKTSRDKTKKKLIIVANETKEKVGMVSLFNIDYKNHNCEIGCYIGTEYQNRGYAKEAKRLMIRFAFEELNMHKIFGHVTDFRGKVLGIDAAVGLKQECTIKESLFTNGKYYDVHIVSLFREDWEREYKDKW